LSTGKPWSWYIASTARCLSESRISWQRAPDAFAAIGKVRNNGRDDIDILVAEVATFASVRIQSTNSNFRVGNAKSFAKIVKHDLDNCG
jgi:uncharacterized membrane-anchored protein